MKEEFNEDEIKHEFGVEKDIEEIHPFDPDRISIDKKIITMDSCLRRLEQGTINLTPDFQRNLVWNLEKKSRLIESLILKIPIPMFYASSDEKGNLTIVDGLQRLSTIRDFILGEEFIKTKNNEKKGEGFKLCSLEFLASKFNNYIFNQIPTEIQNRLFETEFTFTIINPGTPEEVKRNIFKRINTGGEPLTSQEIRHALYNGKSTELLKQLSENENFKTATSSSIDDTRMVARELILRFVAFAVRGYENYPKNSDMDSFLCDTMRVINSFPQLKSKEIQKIFPDNDVINQLKIREIKIIEERFNLAMLRTFNLLEKHAFRKSYSDKKLAPINKSLFEVWSVSLSKISEFDYNKILERKSEFEQKNIELLNNIDFKKSISNDSWKTWGVKTRFEKVNEMLHEIINL